MDAFRMPAWAGRILAVAACTVLVACGGSGTTSASPNLVFKFVTLTGAQENPAVTTSAIATGSFSIDMDSGMVKGSITTSGIDGVAAHIHEGPVGTNAPIIVPLAQGPTGTWTVPDNTTLTATQLESLKSGNLYVNVHSAAHPGGEIRAQIGREVYFATLTGAQEVPATGSAATGTGRFVFDPDTRTLTGGVTTTGITGTLAHLHTAAVGTPGPVTIPMTGGPANWTLPANTVLSVDQVATLGSGNFYANVHSAANPGGEIRGQVFVPIRFANMTGAQETPPNDSTATGKCWLFVNPFDKGVAGRIETTLTNGTAAHAHRAAAGVAGPVVIPMASPTPGLWKTAADATISDDLFASFMKGELYCNVHSAAHPGGEIRGQLLTLP